MKQECQLEANSRTVSVDEKAIPYVEKLAAGEGRAAKDSRVREAAEACLPFLRQRAEQERSRQTLLLRAAGVAGAPPDVLLRPASGATETEPQHLLRASRSGEDAATSPGSQTVQAP